MIMNLELMKQGYEPINLKFNDKERYFETYHEYEETGSYGPICSLVLDYVVEELNIAITNREATNHPEFEPPDSEI